MPSLTLDTSLIYEDIKDIIETHKDTYRAPFTITAKLHTEEKDLDTGDGLLLNGIKIVRDYVNNISDYIEIQLSLHLGTYLYDVYDYLNNIEVTLITIKQLRQGKKPFIKTDRYKAIYIADRNSALPNTINQSKEDLNQNLPITLTLQLLDRSAETIRIKTTQGNFDKAINPKNSDMSPKSFLKSIISEEADKILIENKKAIDKIYIEDPDNKEQLKAITIPSQTRIIELPEYIQNKNVGMYNAGIGCYIQSFGTDHFTFEKCFFIYSMFDPKKYDKQEYKIIFYSPVTSNISGTDITYKYEDKILKVLTYSISKIVDKKETDVMSTGSGFRSSNANSYMKKPVEMKEDGPVFKRNQLATEIVYKDRKDNLNFAMNRSVSANQFSLTSEVLQKKGNYVTIEVSNLDPEFLYPGAACKINYENKEHKVKEVYGVIHAVNITYSSSNLDMPMAYNTTHVALTSHIVLQVFVSTKED